MLQLAGKCYSEFPQTHGQRTPITAHQPAVAVASSDKIIGHTFVYPEELDAGNQDPKVYKMELTQDEGEVCIDIEPKVADSALRQFNLARYQSWVITHAQGDAILNAAQRYRAKTGAGRYKYSLPGGFVGRLSTAFKPGEHGVNCADFAIKILREAGVARVKSYVFNRPARIAKGSH
jgi:hypothetical protein